MESKTLNVHVRSITLSERGTDPYTEHNVFIRQLNLDSEPSLLSL